METTTEDALVILRPGDDGYDQARRVWNAMVDHAPAMIVRCRSTHDVVAAVRLARREGYEIGVRCGGHSVVGHAVPDGGLMIDLTPMGDVRVDPEQRRAWVEGGALLGALDDATQPYGLATTAGNVSHTGVGGLTLGGGMGWLARAYGLACDNVEAFTMVTADGEVVRASADANPELYWGLRGGGGNFGIVTEFVFRLHDVGTRALTVQVDVPAAEAAAPMVQWRDLALEAPRRATYEAVIADGVVSLGLVWVGDPSEGRAYARVLDTLGGEPRVEELSYGALQRRDDTVAGHEIRRYWKGHHFRELTDEAIGVLVTQDPSVLASLQAYGGAIADVAADATAYGQRATAFEYAASVRWTDPAEDADRMTAARAAASRLDEYAYGVYVNLLSDDGAAGVRRAYPPAMLARLTALKDAYDPDNVFHLNQNISPSTR